MRLTQVVIQTSQGDERVYWLQDDEYNGRGLRIGSLVMLAEEGVTTYWTIKQRNCTVDDRMGPWLQANLKANIGTILEFIST